MATLCFFVYVPVAELVEHPAFNRRVVGSNPFRHTSHSNSVGRVVDSYPTSQQFESAL